MKNKAIKKFLSVFLASILIVGLMVIPAYAAWTSRQQKANDILYDVRSVLGYSDTASVFGAATADLYACEFGDTSVAGDFFFSSRTGTIYFMDGSTKKITGTSTTIDIGQYIGGGTYGNIPGYDYSYSGKNLYAGVITGLDNYVNVNSEKATMLARMLMSSVKSESSQTKQAAVGWSVLYCMGGPSNMTEQKMKDTYSWYNTGISSFIDDNNRDLLALAKDIIFRYNAWNNGYTYVGRVLPNNYYWLCYYGNGTTTCRSSQNGADYTFPDAWSTSKMQLHTPYIT